MPGHGGSDAGAVNRYYGETERDYNWREAVELSKRLEASGNQTTICREEHVDESITKMQRRANEFEADLCFCLHHNAFNGSVRGWDIYYHTGESNAFAERVTESFRNHISIGPHGTGLKHARRDRNTRAYNCIRHCQMPTVLVESCFIDNNEDCKWLKDGGWEEVVDALQDATIRYSPAVSPVDPHAVTTTPHDLCEIYVALHRDNEIELPGLMAISFAQWMLESGWCQSELAQEAFNFGGLKDRSEVELGGKHYYKGDYYEKFDCPDNFVVGYWQFLDRSPYHQFNQNKDRYANDPEGFISCIGPTYCPSDQYVSKVLNLYRSRRFRPYKERLESVQG